MQHGHIDKILVAVEMARTARRSIHLDGCDTQDLEEVLQPIEAELARPNPNPNTLATYLNSVARSLRTYPAAKDACISIDEALRDAGLQSTWLS
jgi:hypothetical protein